MSFENPLSFIILVHAPLSYLCTLVVVLQSIYVYMKELKILNYMILTSWRAWHVTYHYQSLDDFFFFLIFSYSITFCFIIKRKQMCKKSMWFHYWNIPVLTEFLFYIKVTYANLFLGWTVIVFSLENVAVFFCIHNEILKKQLSGVCGCVSVQYLGSLQNIIE